MQNMNMLDILFIASQHIMSSLRRAPIVIPATAPQASRVHWIINDIVYLSAELAGRAANR